MKKMKDILKRKVSVGLVAVMLVSQTPATAFAEETVKQETAAEPVSTQEMTAAAEVPEHTEDKVASEAPEQTEDKAVSGTPEEPGDKNGDEAPVGTTGPVEQSNPIEAAKDGSEEETEKQNVQETDKKEAASDGDKEKEEDKAAEEKKTPAFKESRSVDGVRITVEAEEGVFPEGAAALSIEKVTAAQERKAEEAVEDKRPEEQNVAVSYTYDIKVLDQDGNEIQPADESKVKVSFTLEEVADANLTTNVYHIVEEDSQNGGDSGEAVPKEGDNPENSRNEEADAGSSAELTAEKLEVETDGDTAVVETDGFSLYTVEFTYEKKQYVLPGDSEVVLSDILEAVGLSGEASAVEVSNESLFSADKEDGKWVITAHKAFSTTEWMKVLIDGVEYEITVTDDQQELTWSALQAQFDSASTDAEHPTTITLTNDVTAGGSDSALVIPEGTYVTLDLSGHTIDRGLAGQPAVEDGNVITVSGNLTLSDNSADRSGTITGGNKYNCGGVFVAGNGSFTMSGGTITGCSAYLGGGVYVDEGGTFRVSGAPVISGNMTVDSANNVALGFRTTITVFNELTSGAKIYVDAGNKDPVATAGEAYTLKASDMDAFHSDGDGSLVAALDSDGKVKFFTPWGALQAQVNNASTDPGAPTKITLTGDLTADPRDNALCIPGGRYVTLDLNGYTIDRGLTSQANNGNVITVEGHLTISNNSTAHTGTITGGNNTGNGGGVYVRESGEFTMKGGTISGCNVTGNNSKGGGVYVDNNGKFTMEGGTITGCNASENGGGVYVGNNGKFTISGGTITGCNASENGGGVYVDNNGKFTMSGGTITGCNASLNGGGGVYVGNNGEFTMSGGTITSCNATNDGGGVCVNSNGTFTMEGGTISGCIVNGLGCKGGGVYVYGGEFTMKGGTITGCTANNSGGGVFVNYNCTFQVSGAPVIRDNKMDGNDNNVVLVGSETITVTGALTDNAEIWVNAGKDVAFATKGDSYSITDTDLTKFHSEKDSSLVAVEDSDGSVKFFTPWGALQAKFNNASTVEGSPTQIKLTGNVTASGNETALVIPEDRYVTLDLNGHTIDRGFANKDADGAGTVIMVEGDLILTDRSAAQTGTLTGGNTTGAGGGVYVDNLGEFTMEGGTITGCTATGDQSKGGGVYVNSGTFNSGTFIMNGGSITNCSANSEGGGVYVLGDRNSRGTFTMTDGTISDCSATGGYNSNSYGGGVCVNGGTFTMENGTISGCEATNGGGVYFNDGTFTMKNGTINGCNVNDYGGGVYFNDGTFTMENGTISGCEATNGGGVYFIDGTFTMENGTISGCEATNGGGVYVDVGGKFTMNGGTISDCSASYGGGVYVCYGTFTMSGGTIESCSAHNDGGGVYVDDGTFNMSGAPVIRDNKKGDVVNNVVLKSGKTITVTGELTTGAEIWVNAGKDVAFATKGDSYSITDTDLAKFHSDTDSSLVAAEDSDGSVKFFTPWGALQVKFSNASTVSGNPTLITLSGNITAGEGDSALEIPTDRYVTLDLSGNTINRGLTNENAKDAGNVITVNGNLTLTDSSSDKTGKLTGGKNNGNGGGVCVFSGTFTMKGGTISGCEATNGGGVFVNDNCTFQVSGTPVISGNMKKDSTSANNVVLESSETITVTGALEPGAEIYVNAGKGDVVATGENYTLQASDADAFYSDRDSSLVAAEDNNGVKFFTPWGALQAKFSNASKVEGSPTRITLTGSVTASGNETALVIPEDRYVTLDLNGNTINRGLSNVGAVEGGNVITVKGNLTLDDSSDNENTPEYDGTGKLTGGNNNGNGGGVSVEGGKFTMNGGTISGCSVTGDRSVGGGVYNSGTFTMSGGTISDCNAKFGGGGVCVDGGTFTMKGGTISNCSAGDGGGVFVYDNGTFQISGAPVIRDNKKDGNANNVVLDGGKTISVNGALTSGAEIHVNAGKGVVVATGENYTLQASDADAFRSDRDGSLTAALDSDGKVKFFNPWGALQVKFNNASTSSQQPTRITLTGDVTADAGDSALLIPAGRYVTLDLNGHTIDRGLAGQPVGNNGNVITVSGNLTLTDSSSAHTGTITGGNNEQVFGGGVSVKGGTFTMTGGTISGCNAARGGGVNVDSGTFTMTGGTITGCNAYDAGGGVNVDGSFTMNGGTFTMTGGTITDCNATSRGGGVYVEGGGKFTMENGTITGCKAKNFGGGVYVNGSFTMKSGTISGCNVTDDESNGGGVYIEDRGTFKVSGTPVISGNMKGSTSANNVELGGKTISVNGALTSGAEIHVNAGKGVVVATGERYTLRASDADAFRSDRGGSLTAALDSDGKVKFFNPWGALQVKFNNASTSSQQPTRITLTGDLTADAGDSALLIPAGKYVTLDLSGNTIDRGLAGQPVGNNGNVITVSGNLTLTDSSSAHTGTITGGNWMGLGGGVSVKSNGEFTMQGGTISGCNAYGGGGVSVEKNGEFNMQGGTINGCNANGYGGGVSVEKNGEFNMQDGKITDCNGGGVYVKGTFTMESGTISGCNANPGGGVCVDSGTFTMEDGTINGCNSNGEGGGVYVYSGEFTMEGGKITGCKANYYGGVFVLGSGTFKVSGAPVISGNKISDTNSPNNVELNGKTISVIGALTSGAEIHVNAGVGVPIAEKGGDRTTALTETEAGYFKSDVSSDLLGGLNDAGQVVFKKPLPAPTAPANLTYNGTEQTPELTFEGATLTAGTDYTVSYKKVVEGTETSIIGAPKDAGTYKAVAAGKGNYAGTSEAAFTIDRKEVTVSSGIAAKDKTYDRTTDAELITTNAVFTGICDGDSLTVSGNGTFEDASAGTNKTVTIDQSSLTLGGTSSGNYVLASDGNQSETTATINKKKLTITGVTAADKEYDGNTTATTDTTTASVNGLVGSETVTFTVSGSFADANKGQNKPVNLFDWTLTSGGDNYEIDAANSQPTAAASITGTQVYITGISAENKEYDGNKTAIVSGTAVLKKVKDNAIVNDLTVSNITAEFADKNAGDGKAVTITGGTLSDAENYTLIPGATTGLTANITQKPVTITRLSAENKTYDTTNAATVTGTAVIEGKLENDVVTVSAGTAAFDNENVGDNKTVTFTGYSLTGADASNYTLSAQPAEVSANITPAPITDAAVTLSDTQLTYNGSEQTVSVVSVKLGGRDLSGTSDYEVTAGTRGTDVNVYTVTVTGKGNYQGSATAEWQITPKDMTVSAENVSVPYDGQPHGITVSVTDPVNGATILYGTAEGSCTLEYSPTITNVSESPKTVYYQVSADNYKPYTGSATITVVKADIEASEITAPAAESAVYTGSAHALANAGSVAGGIGTMYYALGDSTDNAPADGLFTISVPKAIKAGTYYVWYKIVGDSNHKGKEPTAIAASVISAAASQIVDVPAVEVQKGRDVSVSVNLKGYGLTSLDTSGASMTESSGQVSISDNAFNETTGILSFKVTSVSGGSANITLSGNSANVTALTLKIPVEVKAKTTEVKLDPPDGVTSAVQSVEVEGLSDYTEGQNPQGGESVKVVLEVKPVRAPEDDSGLSSNAIKSAIDSKVSAIFNNVSGNTQTEYLDIKISKQVGGANPETVGDVGRVLEIAIRYDLTGKFNPVVIRQHGDAVTAFTALESKPGNGYYRDGTFYIDKDNGIIYIYSRYFSTYSIAYATVNSHTVTFDAQGGNAVDPRVVADGGKITTLPTSDRSGYSFEGWFTATSGGEKLTTNTVINSDAIYYARWKENSSGGGSGGGGGGTPTPSYTPVITQPEHGIITVNPESPQSGQDAVITVTPEDGYETENVTVKDKDSNTVPVTKNDDGTYTFTQPSTGSVTIEAVIRQATDLTPVIKKPEHGTISVNPAKPKAGEPAIITVTPDEGYEVDSVIVTDKDGKPVAFTLHEDGTYSFVQPASGCVTIEAVLRLKNGVIVRFDLNGKTGTEPDPQTFIKGGKAVRPNDPAAEGYTFTGWYMDEKCKNAYDFDTPVNEDIILYAGWEKKEGPGPDDDDFGIYFAEQADDPYEGVCYNEEKDRYEIVYTGAPIKPLIKVTSKADGVLKEGIDYSVSYSNNKNYSKKKPATIKVSGKGFYKSKKVLELYILQADLEEAQTRGLIAGADELKTLSGKKLNPVIVYRGYKLKSGDLNLSNKDKITADTITDITGKGNFTGTLKDVEVKVIGKDDQKKGAIKVNLKAGKHVYNGEAHELNITTADTAGELTVTAGSSKTPLEEGTDFVVSYSGNTDAGKAAVTITGIGEYNGTVVKNFTIEADKATEITAELSEPAEPVCFNVRGAKPDITVTAHKKGEDETVTDEVLTEGKDYKVSYSSNMKIGDGAYAVKFLGNYKGHADVKGSFKIVQAPIDEAKVEAVQMIYNKPGKYLPKPFVSIDGVQLKNSDYTYKYYIGEEEITSKYKLSLADDETSKMVRIVVTGKGNYTNSTAEGTYEVVRRTADAIDLSKAKIVAKDKVNGKDVKIGKQEYNGTPIEPEIRVLARVNKKWVEVDPSLYTVSYINNLNKGSATILVTGDGEKAIGSKTVKFSISTMRFELFKLIFGK